MDNCIFCKIVRGDIPSKKVYEDDSFLAFLDIKPVAEGHTLLIPKNHFTWVDDLPDDTVSGLFTTAKKLMKDMKANGADFVQLSVVGKDVPHAHVHLIPRMLPEETRERHI